MIIDCISDLHGHFPKLMGGDLLIIAGDCTTNDKLYAWNEFFNWLDAQKYTRKILVAGNHDNFCEQWATSDDSIHDVFLGRPSVTYLCDSGTEFDGYKIWGSPWTSAFKGINPKCMAFTMPFGCDTEEHLHEQWKLIPTDTDILITHSPPFGILDGIPIEDGSFFHAGSISLEHELETRLRPKFHIFGHIHEQGGKHETIGIADPDRFRATVHVNASYVNERYKPVNKPFRIYS